VSAEPARAAGFYGAVLGWEAENLMPEDHPGDYFVCRLRGRDVAAIVSEHGAPAPPHAVWTTLVWVESADETAAKAVEVGGTTVAEPFDSPGGGRQVVLADPAGAVFSVWEPRGRRGAQVVKEPGAWAMSALNSADLDASRAFYGALFGWQTETFGLGDAEMTLWKLPGYVGGEPQQPVARDVIAITPPAGGGGSGDAPPHWSVDFWVRDLEEAVETVAERGGRAVVEPYEVPGVGMKQAVVADPWGGTLSLTQPPGLG
jgi:predicted enzyme related to lactoylglutathione lyase